MEQNSPGFLWLVLQVACTIGFAQTMRLGQTRGAAVWSVSWLNYASASAGAAAWYILAGHPPPHLAAIGLGVLDGLFFALNMMALLASYRVAGVGVTYAAMNCGIVLPVVLAWILWDDPMTPGRWMALPAVCAALALMRPAPRDGGAPAFAPSLVATFALKGCQDATHKAFTVYAPAAQRPFYILAIFLVAGLVSLVYAIRQRSPVSAGAAALGGIAGQFNVWGAVFMLLGLAVLPAAVYFPMSTAGMVTFNTLLSWILWKERLTPRQFAGMAVAIAVVWLVNQ